MNIEFFTSNVSCFFVEVEVHPDRAAIFVDKYSQISGETPVVGAGYQYQRNKWGTECRIYFNSMVDLSCKFAELKINVEKGARSYKSKYNYRINSCEFFWSLINAGHRLGVNEV